VKPVKLHEIENYVLDLIRERPYPLA
jgi:hypothetical protein